MFEIELTTPQPDGTTRVDKPIEYLISIGSDTLICFFNTSARIGEKDFGEVYDGMNPVTLPIEQIQAELQTIFEKLLDLRTAQIEGESNVNIAHLPDYKTFFNELLTLPIFRLAQSQNREDLVLNAAYTDFSVILSNSISGAENVPALQASFDAVLGKLVFVVFGEDKKEEYLSPLREAIARCHIPLSIKENT